VISGCARKQKQPAPAKHRKYELQHDIAPYLGAFSCLIRKSILFRFT
jgi:hypothetical protein